MQNVSNSPKFIEISKQSCEIATTLSGSRNDKADFFESLAFSEALGASENVFYLFCSKYAENSGVFDQYRTPQWAKSHCSSYALHS